MSKKDESTLKNLKSKVKHWESEFFKINQKKPNKEDITNAPLDIKEAYKSYWKLKKKENAETNINKDDVWSESLNKSNLKPSKLKYNGHYVKTICDKLKQKSCSFNEKKNVSLASEIFKPEVTNSATSLSEEADVIPISYSKSNSSRPIGNVHKCDSPLKENTGVIKRFKSVRSVNLVPSTVGFTPSVKSLQFDQNINADWLERCDFTFTQTVNTEKSEEISDQLSVPNIHNIKNDLNGDLQKIPQLTENKQNYQELNKNKQNYQKLDENKQNYEKLDQCEQNYLELKKSKHNLLDLNESDQNYKVNESEQSNCQKKASQQNFDGSTEKKILKDEKFIPSKDSFIANDVNDAEHITNAETNPSTKPHTENLNLSLPNKLKSEKVSPPTEEHPSERKPPLKRQKLDKSSESFIYVSSSSQKAAHLKRKIAAGSLNENFVRLDIKKKKFSRGFRSTNVKKLKWNKWKQLKKNSQAAADKSSITGCFKCGDFGHWAKNCPSVTYSKETTCDQFENEELDDMHLPTLEEAAKLLREKDNKISVSSSSSNVINVPDENDPSISYQIKDFNIFVEEEELVRDNVDPLYEADKNGKIKATPKAVYESLKEFGYSNFRDGQETAIMRVLSGLSTLVVLPTGSGKSLCYQLPAYMYAKFKKSFAVVVSPLVSLMEDQITGLPSCLHAVCLHSGMSDSQKTAAIELISDGKAQIVLVSPEAVISYGFIEKLQVPNMPPISFVCIDEVHCLSQWSHNFRPSYLQLYKVLTQKLGVKCILGLTATATRTAITDIITHLNLDCSENSVVGQTNVPQNLHLSVSKDKDKDRALIQLLSGDRFRNCSSIIIYCIRRVETERLATLIRTCMQDQVENDAQKAKKKSNSKKRCFVWTAEAYHAGLAPPRRRSIQKKFMSGKLRVVIATIAFGMGLDKPDVRAIIHYNMPKNFESYVQEIGRAGRDGLDSHCHLFLDSEQKDLWEQQRHIFSDGIDRHTLRKLLRKVFLPCICSTSNPKSDDASESLMESDASCKCSKHEVAFSINDTVQELDVKQENISTLLCYLELHPSKWIEILSPTYATCSIRCYGGPQQMHNIALKNPAIAAAIALDTQHGKTWKKSSHYTFDVVRVSSAIGCKSSVLKRELKKLEWNEKRKTGVMVEFSDLAFHIMAPGNLSDDESDLVLDFLFNKVLESEKAQLKSLELLFATFQKYSSSHYWECCDEVNMEFSSEIKSAINQYFDRHDSFLKNSIENKETKFINPNEVDITYVKQLIKDIIGTHHDQNFTGRAIARIFHGISSPCFPSEVWGRVRKFWRCLLPVDFNTIMKMANEELRNSR